MVHWMQRWLKGIDEPVRDEGGMQWTEADLRCTPQGQVLRLPGERSVIELNAERERKLAAERAALWKSATPDELRKRIRAIAGIRPLDEIPQPKASKSGVVERDGYRIEKFVLEASDGVPLPALLFVPPQAKRDAVLYLHGEGKHADGAPGGAIEKLVREGQLVLAVDIRGTGETLAPAGRSIVANEKAFFLAYLLGKSLVGLRAEDVLVSGRFLANHDAGTRPRTIRVVACGDSAFPALYAAALEPSMFADTRVSNMPCESWADVVRDPNPVDQLPHAVHAALAVYDLPDLLTLVGKTKPNGPIRRSRRERIP